MLFKGQGNSLKLYPNDKNKLVFFLKVMLLHNHDYSSRQCRLFVVNEKQSFVTRQDLTE